MVSTFSTLVHVCEQLRVNSLDAEEARKALHKCDEISSLLRAFTLSARSDIPSSSKRAVSCLSCEAGGALTLSSLPPELLARIAAALPSVEDVCRVECVSRLFRGAPRARSVIDEAMHLRVWARRDSAEKHAEMSNVTASRARAQLQTASLEADTEKMEAASATILEAESSALANKEAARVDTVAARAMLVSMRRSVISEKQWLVREERRHRMARPLTVAAGSVHSAFVDANGQLLTCGYGATLAIDNHDTDFSGVLGQGPDVSQANVPAAVLRMSGVRVASVAAAVDHTLALSADGAVYSFGTLSSHVLMNPNGDEYKMPRPIDSLREMRVTKVACAVGCSIVLTDTGHAYSWGRDEDGRLGHGFEQDVRMPCLIQALAHVRMCDVSVSNTYALALDDSGELYSWGRGHIDYRLTPGRTFAFGMSSERVTAVAAGEFHTLVVSEAGKLYSWGDDSLIGRQCNSVLPYNMECEVELPAGVLVRAVSVGQLHSLALSDTGDVYSWGVGSKGQLGHGYLSHRHVPTRIEGLHGVCVQSVASGSLHSLAVGSDGAVYGWGMGAVSALGLELTEHQLVPMRYPSLRQRHADSM